MLFRDETSGVGKEGLRNLLCGLLNEICGRKRPIGVPRLDESFRGFDVAQRCTEKPGGDECASLLLRLVDLGHSALP